MNVLVFPCGSEIGLELYRSLCFSIHINLFGGSSVNDHGKYVYENYIGDIPNVDDPDFIERLNKVIQDNDIKFIFPAHDSVVLRLSEAQQKNKLECGVIASPFKTCHLARSKRLTYLKLKDVISTPKEYSKDNPPKDYPVFVKPDVGQGSKGAKIINNYNDLVRAQEESANLIICEYLPGEEYTVDCFTDKNRKLRFVMGRLRARTSNGISTNSCTIRDIEFNKIASKINDSLEFRGPWFFQLKRDKSNRLVLLEIATRIAGTSGLTRARGVNLALLGLFDAMGKNIEIIDNEYDAKVDRALYNVFSLNITYSHVYIDFDDVLVINQQVNADAIHYLYMCKNKGIKIHLLSRHRKEIDKSLERYSISHSLFEDINIIGEIAKKSDYIREANSIFIDDSFAERLEVYRNRQIPTFDAHMIEVLITSGAKHTNRPI